MSDNSRLLLISNSTLHGSGYLDHVADEIGHFLGSRRRILFFPFALHNRDAYADKVAARFAELGYAMQSAHRVSSVPDALDDAEAVFVGGGNTFRLLKALQQLEIIDLLRRRVREGMPYIGSSAGSNIAAPTIKTTNDMPIVEPRSFEALGIVPFQINPHYQDADPASTHMGETREERIVQFLEENTTPVVGLREGAWILAERQQFTLGGTTGARIFCRDREPVEMRPGDDITNLVTRS